MTIDGEHVADLAVVGAGPAGLAATVTALSHGLRVTFVDSGSQVGGQFWRHPPRGSALPEHPEQHHDLETYRSLCRHLEHYASIGRLRVLLEHDVWTAERSSEPLKFAIHAVDRSRPPTRACAITVRARAMLVATGAFDRPMPFEGWDLPGVYTAGALQALLKGGGVVAGGRVVVGGTGPFLLPVAVGLAQAGARVVAVCEASTAAAWLPRLGAVARVPGKLGEGAQYAAELIRRRIPVYQRHVVVRAHGTDRVEAVTVARVDSAGTRVAGTERTLEADAVGVGWGFVPRLDLALTLAAGVEAGSDGTEVLTVDSSQHTSVAGLFAAGEVTGIGGAALALAEGRIAGEAASAFLGALGASTARPRRVARDVVRHRAFAEAMSAAHPVPTDLLSALPDETLVCRCEEVDAGAVRSAMDGGARDARQVKQLTRAGMGWCQGRMCTAAVECLLGGRGGGVVERLVAAPVPLGALALRDSADDAM